MNSQKNQSSNQKTCCLVKVWDGENLTVPKEMGTPQEHHFLSTNLDNLIEACGRVCYDSCSMKNSRGSKDYHDHIIEVNHGSVQEHAVITISIDTSPTYTNEVIAASLLNRPGVWGIPYLNTFRITANIRSIREWSEFNNRVVFGSASEIIGDQLRIAAKRLCPLACSDIELKYPTCLYLRSRIEKPIFDEEKWYSFYIGNVSRGLSHELVRHKFRTAISQRSTRYVDESESNWSWHPLILKYWNEYKQYSVKHGFKLWDYVHPLDDLQSLCQEEYDNLTTFLQNRLIEDQHVDKFTARKQARGAARGILGNALSTELIFSASLAQWKRIIAQRSSKFADAEIRLLGNELIRELGLSDQYSFEETIDGIGFHTEYK